MKLRQDITDLLSGFASRMKFINISHAILDYPYRDNIREMIPDREILDNLTVAVLVFIKERTLGTQQQCTLSDVQAFLENLVPILPDNCKPDCKLLASYLVVDVLQNSGLPMEYLTYIDAEENFAKRTVRLLEEEKGSYHLSDEAFDFLFRSKEIESELDYSVTRFRLKEYMKRDNYTQAVEQSRELISRIRNMKTGMDDFLQRCRENLSAITEDAYESVIQRIRTLLNDEEKELTEIQQSAQDRMKQLEIALQSGINAEETEKTRQALREIIRNITTTINEQRSLINKRFQLSSQFEQILKDHYAMQHFERMNFADDILAPLQRMGDQLGDAVRFLLFPLCKPELPKLFSIENFFALQFKLTEENDDHGILIDTEKDDKVTLLEQARNQLYQDIMQSLFTYMQIHREFTVTQFIGTLSNEELFRFCEEKAFPNVLLKLFEIGTVDIAGWKQATTPIPEPKGEFEPAWCLSNLDDSMLQMQEIHIKKPETNRKCSFSVTQGGTERQISMTDFCVEVI
ncbi:hypothetical protein [Ruminococcus sp.]|jgi:hypothetical protein|uniref:hypothetical protein n=1 Tax=Ruminococcus sp. TaxID=41978 RepID=UPI0025CFBC08|nr:hypothetical protein [Ruminococcus sp.]